MKNELIHESSPYLLQHAHNPVNWQSWSENTLRIAKEADKPILLSIGYSACHWCHVMEKESFENEAVAGLMNEYFINIKVDREERPDLDHVYMDAVQAITGSGGWPLNVFLTPDGKPFYGGTYFPPVKSFNRMSWPDVIQFIHEIWRTKRTEIEQQANVLTEHIKKSGNPAMLKPAIVLPEKEMVFSKTDCDILIQNLMQTADTKNGGFGNAPKFPQTFSINILLQASLFLNDEKALIHAQLCLNKMLNGGIYDQLAGGLCRYSTDEEWLVPHFEKMLYDNALLLITLSDAFALTKNELYRQGIENTLNFLRTEMKSEDGGYFTAIDADSEGQEGKFYVWSEEEIMDTLQKDAAIFNDYFGVTKAGNWEGKNILHVTKTVTESALENNLSVEKVKTIIESGKQKLMNRRQFRTRPANDDKILFGWNSLLLTGFCKTFCALQDEKLRTAAKELFVFIEKVFKSADGHYFHTYKNGCAKHPAFLDDYAYYIQACIQLQEITGEEFYLQKAAQITEFVLQNFACDESEFLFFTPFTQTDIVARKIEVHDGATPSANAVMAQNIFYLSVVFDNSKWQQKSVSMIFSLKKIIIEHPGSFGIWAAQAINIAVGFNEIVIIGEDMMPQLQNVLLHFIPNKILQASTTQSAMPMLAEKAVFPKTFLYLCRNYMCMQPFGDTGELIQAIGKGFFNFSDHNI